MNTNKMETQPETKPDTRVSGFGFLLPLKKKKKKNSPCWALLTAAVRERSPHSSLSQGDSTDRRKSSLISGEHSVSLC